MSIFWNYVFPIIIIVAIFVALYIARNKIKKNESNIIKSLLLFPFIFTLHLIISIEINFLIKNSKNTFENMLSILFIMIFISLMLIMLVLIISSYGNEQKFWHSMKIIVFIFCIIIPIWALPNPSGSLKSSIIVCIVSLFMLLDLIISYDFAFELSTLDKKSSFVKIGHKQISSEWIGFLGTVITAILSFVSALLTHGIK